MTSTISHHSTLFLMHHLPVPFPVEAIDPERLDLGFATVGIAGRNSAQGPVLRRFRDGRVTIDAGGFEVTGRPVGTTARRSWWRALTN